MKIMGRFEVVSTIPKPITISLCCLLKDKENMRAKISSLEKDIAKMKTKIASTQLVLET